MEVAGPNMRECSVVLRRCDLLGRGGATRGGTGAPTMPHEVVASGASYTTDHVRCGQGTGSGPLVQWVLVKSIIIVQLAHKNSISVPVVPPLRLVAFGLVPWTTHLV
ncbi:hypothetical protein EVAR_59378_1 [Eumeta japonica]|uniref:Uncharacterized protein n=1 Tax=Eumeta variegata TaxID=151549 RepID=A0A4C1ZY70_EUMVA|nr:hypothetical protein EVAR_59378_1 [Eumeta japonica]